MTNHTPKLDDRSDNVEKLQSMIHHTIENMEDAEAAMSNSSPEDQQRIKAKNERRRDSIDSFRAEIKDEAHNEQ
ncbi:small acid-soluble spore protein Tlp [Mesobacillus subterraneus]|uniref:small acid-soluble spore protein Tlp n=1 Tax=Mesobacillus subterraneus TaxID=285983 RepID=UPI001CFC5430|nr:small acid-soluble spore protein Tlp [Mesobacillus subterraneus]WLR57081.1 small acid-soluble spore protein Tlp [Mesobacillus subterraneus]